MSRRLDDLCPRFRVIVEAVIARCVEAGQPILIVDTLRTQAEQIEYLRRGVSKTRNSMHLPQAGCAICGERRNSDGSLGLAHAIDLAPFEVWQAHGPDKISWDPKHPGWKVIGDAAHASGASWGGDWKSFKDLAHVQDALGVGKVARVTEGGE